jgi:hypothetical protein
VAVIMIMIKRLLTIRIKNPPSANNPYQELASDNDPHQH